jgi:hypothetical protein
LTNEDFVFQANYKLQNGDLINVRGGNAAEFEANIDAMQGLASKVAQLAQNLRGLTVLVSPPQQNAQQQLQAEGFVPRSSLPDSGVYQQPQQGIQRPQQPVGAPEDVPMCNHGPMSFNDRKWNGGQGWKAFMCPAPQDGSQGPQCTPLFWDKFKKQYLPPKDKR